MHAEIMKGSTVRQLQKDTWARFNIAKLYNFVEAGTILTLGL